VHDTIFLYFATSEIWNLEFGIIQKYFQSLTAGQVEQFKQLGRLYPEWNAKINVISRQDIDNLFERHILHSLGIAKVLQFKPGTKILDAGTGGGFPGIPLAILFPETQFHLIDSTAKKIAVVTAVATETNIKNITTEHQRLENHLLKYDFVVSRAVATLDQMVDWVFKNVRKDGFNAIPNGLLYLKGGDFAEEMKSMEAGRQGGREAERLGDKRLEYDIYELSEFFTEPFFLTKKVIHIF
jgi:16S rRNA (guanine527-N7)-methyltransferase